MSYLKWIIIICITIISAACIGENGPNESSIIGMWELDEATRDGQNTTLLEGVFFEFFEDGSLKTNFNLSGAEALSKYDLKGLRIIQSESELNLDYNIAEINDTSLVLDTELRGAKYQLLLKKRNPEE